MSNMVVSEKLLSKMVEDDYSAWHTLINRGMSRKLFGHLNSNDKSFSAAELKLIRHLLSSKVRTEQIIRITTPSFSDEQVNQLIIYIDKLNANSVEIFAKSELSIQQMEYCYILFSLKIASQNISIFCTFTEPEMKEICSFYWLLPNTKVKSITNKIWKKWIVNNVDCSSKDTKTAKEYRAELLDAFKSGLTIDKIKLLINPEFSLEQVRALRKGFIYGLSMEQVKTIAHPEIPSEQMLETINKILKASQISQLKKDLSGYTLKYSGY